MTTATEGDSVSDFVGFAVTAEDFDAAFDPDGATDVEGCVFDEADGGGEVRFVGFACFFIPDDESSAGAVGGFFFDDVFFFLGCGCLDEVPDLAVGVTEAGKGAVGLIVGEDKFFSFGDFCVVEEGGHGGCFGGVPVGVGVLSIAEGFVLRGSAAAEGAGFFFAGVGGSFAVFPGVAFFIEDDDFLVYGRFSEDEVGAVFDDFDIEGIGCFCGAWFDVW